MRWSKKLIKSNTVVNTTEKAMKNFEDIKKSLKGLMEIASISANSENDIYYQLARDNIIVLYHNLVDLIFNSEGIKELKDKLKESKIDFDIISNDWIKTKK